MQCLTSVTADHVGKVWGLPNECIFRWLTTTRPIKHEQEIYNIIDRKISYFTLPTVRSSHLPKVLSWTITLRFRNTSHYMTLNLYFLLLSNMHLLLLVHNIIKGPFLLSGNILLHLCLSLCKLQLFEPSLSVWVCCLWHFLLKSKWISKWILKLNLPPPHLGRII